MRKQAIGSATDRWALVKSLRQSVNDGIIDADEFSKRYLPLKKEILSVATTEAIAREIGGGECVLWWNNQQA